MDKLNFEYQYNSSEPAWQNQYLLDPLEKIVLSENLDDKRIFEVGCGNGTTANMLYAHGFEITAIDPSKSGIKQAKSGYPHIKFEEGSAYDDLANQYGTFPIVVSLEVVEHVFSPRKYSKTVYELLQPGGVAIISTPYHGYFKNLVIAITGKFDSHVSPLWDGGHIKFWSQKTLRSLLEEAGFTSIDFIRVGRIPILAKSMIAIARKK